MKGNFMGVIICLLFSVAHAQQISREPQSADESAVQPSLSTTAMNNLRLEMLIRRIDKDASGKLGYWKMHYEGMEILIITDEKADRMRIISAIIEAEKLPPPRLYRLMQANFDTALDARYAIARRFVWSAFIHPLSSLGEREFFSALAQVITLSVNFGSSYSSGALVFEGGDSRAGKQHKDILRKGLSF